MSKAEAAPLGDESGGEVLIFPFGFGESPSESELEIEDQLILTTLETVSPKHREFVEVKAKEYDTNARTITDAAFETYETICGHLDSGCTLFVRSPDGRMHPMLQDDKEPPPAV